MNTKHRFHNDRTPGKRPIDEEGKNKADRPNKKKYTDQSDRKIPDRRER